ncbi:MAG: GntR family transcriptional regulator [Lentisphaerota bacterium]
MVKQVYQQIYEDILSKINLMHFSAGEKLPTERQLIKQYEASDTSVRRALAILVKQGYIVKRHGSGNYVCDKVAADGAETDPDIIFIVPRHFGINIGLPELRKSLSQALPGIKLRIMVLDKASLEPEQARRLMEHYRKPFVMLNTRNQTAKMARDGLLTPMESLPQMAERIDRMPENLKWLFNGLHGELNYFGCPYLYTSVCFAINSELAEKAGLDMTHPPRLWSELLQWGRVFTEWRDSHGCPELSAFFGYHRRFFVNLGAFFFMATDGEPWAAPDAEFRRGLKDFFTFLEGLFDGGMTDTVSIQAPDPFVSGKYLFSLQAGSWYPRDIRNFRPEMRCRFLPFPVPAAGRPRFSSSGTELLSLMLPDGKHEAGSEVMRLFNALFSPDLCKPLAWRFGTIPADPQLARQHLLANPEMEPFYDALFTSLEPHCLEDEALSAKLNEIIKCRLDNRKMRLDDTVIDEYMAFASEILPRPHTFDITKILKNEEITVRSSSM